MFEERAGSKVAFPRVRKRICQEVWWDCQVVGSVILGLRRLVFFSSARAQDRE